MNTEKNCQSCIYYKDGYCENLELKPYYPQKGCDDFCYNIVGTFFTEIEKFVQLQMEHKEQTLAEIITKYDFIVGSKECKCKLMEILPERANVICSPYIASPTMIYVIKKFDIMDLVKYEE